jgi:predicted nucleotidyltransferase
MFKTELLDKAINEHQLALESKRKELLERTLTWLYNNADKYGIDGAYIFGSVTQKEKFTESSDIDIAVHNINPESYCVVISLLMTELERDVDIIKLDKCHFAKNIRDKGILWKKID